MIDKRLLIVFIVVVLLAGAFVIYSYLTPDIQIAVGTQSGENYIGQPLIAWGTKYNLPLPAKDKEHIIEFGEKTLEVTENLQQNYVKPIQVKASVEIVDGQTIVAYSGTVTEKDGKTEPYEEQLIFDYIITQSIH